MKKSKISLLIGFTFLALVNCKDKGDADPAIPAPKIETYFDAAYIASSGFEDFAKSQAISDGKPARVIKDLIGTRDLIWSKDKGILGADIPGGMWTTPPVFTKDDFGGYITVQNIMPNLWLSSDFDPIPQPYDVYTVLRDLQGVRYEGYFQVGYGLRNQGEKLEFKMETADGNKTLVNMASGTILEDYKMTIVRMRVDGANSKLWINNELVSPGAVNLGGGKIIRMGYGTNSHAAYHDFFGMWVKFGTLSESDHADIYDKLSTAFKPGTYPTDKPLATKVKAEWNNAGGWNAAYTYFSPTGIAEDKTKTEYQWGYHIRNTDLNESKFIPGATKATLLRSDYPALILAPYGTGLTEIFVMVKVYDINGNSWSRLLRSELALDNIK